ncbi:InlB B-repeat-containing protein [Methanimicrococcus blatticola]|nr:InlB B-repeat-containing protein [Methanimicrococcus blatticola]
MVIFEYDEDHYYKKSVPRFTVMSEIEAPEKEGYIFGGWYLDPACTEPYDFSQPVTEGFYLFPKWIPENEIEELSPENFVAEENSPSGYTSPISSNALAVILAAALVVCFGASYFFSKRGRSK